MKNEQPPTWGDRVRRILFDGVGGSVYATRVLLIPFYACLVVGMVAYCYDIIVTAFAMLTSIHTDKESIESTHLIQILSLLDICMVANLVIQILIGSYMTFVRPMDETKHNKIPLGFKGLTPGKLKIKMSMSIIGVSSIHLLRIFVQSGQPGIPQMSWQDFIIKITIHAFFIVSAIVMAKTDKIMEGLEHEEEKEPDKADKE